MRNLKRGTPTAGPWSTEASLDDIAIIGADGNQVCAVWGVEHAAPEDLTAWANARLIAAAPELLAFVMEIGSSEGVWADNPEALRLMQHRSNATALLVRLGVARV